MIDDLDLGFRLAVESKAWLIDNMKRHGHGIRPKRPPVGVDDLELWAAAFCPRLPVCADRLAQYLIFYSIGSKIDHAKRRGDWPPHPIGH